MAICFDQQRHIILKVKNEFYTDYAAGGDKKNPILILILLKNDPVNLGRLGLMMSSLLISIQTELM